MTTIELVSHVYAGKLAQYAAMLQYQLSSLVLYPPRDCGVIATICWCAEDSATADVLNYFGRMSVQNVHWNFMLLPHDHLMQRAIGRNKAAKATKANVVWFCDCDYWFAEGCLDHLASIYSKGELPRLAFPRKTMICLNHATGDVEIARVLRQPPRIVKSDPAKYGFETNPRAIGGIQIVAGEIVRRSGYCDGHRKFQQPAETFQPMRSDREFRKQLGAGYGTPIDLLGVYRIRHSEIGYECNKRH